MKLSFSILSPVHIETGEKNSKDVALTLKNGENLPVIPGKVIYESIKAFVKSRCKNEDQAKALEILSRVEIVNDVVFNKEVINEYLIVDYFINKIITDSFICEGNKYETIIQNKGEDKFIDVNFSGDLSELKELFALINAQTKEIIDNDIKLFESMKLEQSENIIFWHETIASYIPEDVIGCVLPIGYGTLTNIVNTRKLVTGEYTEIQKEVFWMPVGHVLIG